MNSTIPEDIKYMQRCIELALNGALYVSPNPMVGCVIVENGKIIGEGFHQKYGDPHAEVNAINTVKNPELLKKSTLYVNLEPCAHHGKTPPCTDLIIQKKIPRVVIGNMDPNKQVAGKGIEKLKKSGCEIYSGIMETECYNLNKIFFTYHLKKRPYIILKWAESADGFIDKIRDKEDPVGPNWITNEKCRQLVHKWRAECQAIMVGANTVKKDNPQLNVRSWPGNDPIRVIIDKNLDIPESSVIYNKKQPTLVFTYNKATKEKNLEFVKIEDKKDIIGSILKEFYKRQIISLFVEGGTKLLQELINKGFWDEARVFKGNINFKKGIEAPLIRHATRCYETIFNTQIVHMYNKSVI